MRIRDATASDYGAYVRLVAELGVDDPVPSATRFVDELRARTLVAVDAHDEVIGYVLVEELHGVGYIRNIVSDPARRRTGVGVALMAAARARFLAAGATTWCLNVKPDNAAAIGLYARFGMRTAYRSTILRLPSGIALPPTDLVLAPLPAERDADVEPLLRLLPGQLASARTRPSRYVLGLSRGDELLGACVYIPAMPGAFPFRLRSPAHAAAFIALLRTFTSIPNAAFLQVGVEDDDALAAEVLRLGAYVQLELLHLRGPL